MTGPTQITEQWDHRYDTNANAESVGGGVAVKCRSVKSQKSSGFDYDSLMVSFPPITGNDFCKACRYAALAV